MKTTELNTTESKLRAAKITFECGDVINTSMAAHLTDQQIRDYYKIGSYFNLGSVEDRMSKVSKVEILR